ncbi:hypothetical protein SAMN02745824_0386 [Parasphingorhabdus marina DSM 22363]|uniref:Uncharacterized protein n=1 Tax=Parasphingorhabdus marina DSM 22363 TaxID=1123272 RepID=A0A1N6CN29_9SPHN|nr:hypothetical protein SAMN02745824_0386 [Parasphingorhabdus marina DSM 22363]
MPQNRHFIKFGPGAALSANGSVSRIRLVRDGDIHLSMQVYRDRRTNCKFCLQNRLRAGTALLDVIRHDSAAHIIWHRLSWTQSKQN